MRLSFKNKIKDMIVLKVLENKKQLKINSY